MLKASKKSSVEKVSRTDQGQKNRRTSANTRLSSEHSEKLDAKNDAKQPKRGLKEKVVKIEQAKIAQKVLYGTELGQAILGDSLEVLRSLESESVDLVMTSPPYALHFKKEYGNVDKGAYIEWFLPFAREIKRVLKPTGSFVLNIGGSYNQGAPTRSIYHYKLLVALVEEVGLHLAQECFWFNPAKMPVPAEWVTVRRVRIRDSVEYVWWLSKTEHPKADNRNVLKPYSEDMLRLNRRGVKTKVRPSGHAIQESFDKIHAGGSIPPNVVEESSADSIASDMLKFGNNAANDAYTMRCKEANQKIHPARFPAALPEFFVKLLTSEGDLVVDPFAGSNTTGAVCESLKRKWTAIEMVEEYLLASQFRFGARQDQDVSSPKNVKTKKGGELPLDFSEIQ